MKNVLAFLALLLLCVNGWGCAPQEPPTHYSIDPELSEAEHAVIEDVVAGWGEKTGWAPTRVTWSERGRFQLVDSLKGGCAEEEGRECEVTARNTDDRILIKRTSWARGDLDLFWVMMAHEVGHFCAEHTRGGIMAARHSADSAHDLTIDAEAVRAWKAGCH